MTKKHFEAVAAAIKKQFDNAQGLTNEFARNSATTVVYSIAQDFARIAASDNPRFDTQRFLRACSISKFNS